MFKFQIYMNQNCVCEVWNAFNHKSPNYFTSLIFLSSSNYPQSLDNADDNVRCVMHFNYKGAHVRRQPAAHVVYHSLPASMSNNTDERSFHLRCTDTSMYHKIVLRHRIPHTQAHPTVSVGSIRSHLYARKKALCKPFLMNQAQEMLLYILCKTLFMHISTPGAWLQQYIHLELSLSLFCHNARERMEFYEMGTIETDAVCSLKEILIYSVFFCNIFWTCFRYGHNRPVANEVHVCEGWLKLSTRGL